MSEHIDRQSRIAQVLGGQRVDPPPYWFMRQAGRYLPEYKQLRERAGSFLDLVYTPEMAAEVTLQPLRRFDCDAAILFSDILIVPNALGQPLNFEAGEGPKLEPIQSREALAQLSQDRLEDSVAPVYETVARVRSKLSLEKAVIGFCGGVWTVASYVVAGRGGDDQAAAKRWAYRDPDGFCALLDLLEAASATYLIGQARAGAHVLQIFDSWAANLPEPFFERFVIMPTRRIIERVKAAVPETRIIGFPRGVGGLIERYVRESGVDAVSLDTGVAPAYVKESLPAGFPVQGNLDPIALVAGGDTLHSESKRILAAFANRPHIMNLGHGIVPDTPPEHVAELTEMIKTYK